MIVGENDPGKYFWEKYDSRWRNRSLSGQININIPNIEKLKQYNYNQPNLIIEYDESYQIDFESRDYSKKSILFGSDIEPFQIEIDSVSGSIEAMPIPTALDLKNFQAICRINNNQVFLAGGIINKLSDISDRAYIYDLNSRTVTRTTEMRQIRYTFPVVHHKGFVYAIGGREFGGDDFAIIHYTERCNLETLQWEELPSLNVKRCTSNAFVVNNRVFVAGGYHSSKNRTETIEVFNEEKFRWECFGINLSEPLEASQHLVKNNLVYFFGGRTIKGDCKTKQVIDVSQGDLGEAKLLPSSLKYKGCLSKMVYVKKYYFIFGSDNFNNIDVISESNMDIANYEEFTDEFDYSNNLKGTAIHEPLKMKNFCKDLEETFKSINFSENKLKRHSYILPSGH